MILVFYGILFGLSGVVYFLQKRRLGLRYSLEDDFFLHVSFFSFIGSVISFVIGFEKIGWYCLYAGILWGIYNVIGEVIDLIKGNLVKVDDKK